MKNYLRVALCAAVILLIGASAFAQLTDTERKCSDAFNKANRNVANQEQKANRKCIKDGNGDVSSCVNAVSPKAADKELKVEALFAPDGKCDPNAAFGVVSSGTPAGDDAAKDAENGTDNIIRDIWGNPVDGIVADDKCADAVAKRTGKIYDTILKAFRGCAKGLASIPNIAALEGCVTTAIGDAKVSTFAGKLTNDITNKCATSAPIVAGTEDGECSSAATQADFSACALASAKCNACLAINAYTDGNANCDSLDDGSVNGSCGSAVCGDSVIQPEFGEQCDPPGVNSPDCVNVGDTCSATCQCEAPVCGNNVIEYGEVCDPPGSGTCPFAGDTCNGSCGCDLPLNVHRCTFNGATDNSQLTLCFLGSCIAPFDTTGAVDILCDPGTEDVNGKRVCQCNLRQYDPVFIPGTGYACIDPAPGCPDGEVDCDGGNSLNIDAEANAQLSACTSNADCASQCGTYCSGIGKSVYVSGCESFCQGGTRADLPCECDTLGALTCNPASTLDCPNGSCEGKDNEADIDCHCTCIDEAVAPASAAGQITCHLGVAIRVESSLPCDGVGVIVRLPPQCAPFTSGTSTLILNNLNESVSSFGPFSETGTNETCANLDTSVTTGYELVSVLAFYDSTIGDLISRLVVDCQ